MKRAVVFDLDGVLIDSDIIYCGWTDEFLRKNGICKSWREISSLAGTSMERSDQMIYEWWRDARQDGRSKEEVCRLANAYYETKTISFAAVLNPGVKELLTWLRGHGIKTAVASSSPEQAIRQALKETGLSQDFDEVVSGHAFKESKPHPEIYLYTMKRLGAEPWECVAVEDSPYGIRAGKRAGMQVIAKRDTRFLFDQGEADFMVDNLIEIIDILEKENRKDEAI